MKPFVLPLALKCQGKGIQKGILGISKSSAQVFDVILMVNLNLPI
jgi:hypothetical protein